MERNKYINDTLNNYKMILETKGYIVLYIGLYGSQNYNLDDELSDIDAKAIVLPSLNDIIFRKTVSKVHDFGNGTVDVKDLITFYSVIKKGNFSYIESINTEYSIGDKYIKDLFKQIKPNLMSIYGAMMEKRKALTHEYPSKQDEFQKWGFDPKQYHHILRLYDLLEINKFYNIHLSFLDYETHPSSIPLNFLRDELINIKRNKDNLSKEYVQNDADIVIKNAKEKIPKNYKYEVIDLDYEVFTFIESYIRKDILDEE